MQDLTEFIRHIDEQLAGSLGQQQGKYAHFDVMWDNARYEVYYVLRKGGKGDWEMMAYARID
ncbi:MAG TPA: hypothetical protein VG367_21080 [Mucilaginibacter sp.]|jgi:hypothetical protein|nr:hypothetical protein [Mucilaginibacter sp.]